MIEESTYRGIEKETAVVRDLVFALGYEPLTEVWILTSIVLIQCLLYYPVVLQAGELEGQLVMYDLQSSRPALSAFHDYASSELAETTCLSVKDLLSIGKTCNIVSEQFRNSVVENPVTKLSMVSCR